MRMEYIGKFISNFRELYGSLNAATLTGAIDVVIVQQEDGTFLSSPFHVRFGKLGVLRSREKVVDLEINDNPVDIHMKLGESGEAFFVSEFPVIGSNGKLVPPHMATSPIPPSFMEDMMEETNTSKSDGECIGSTVMSKEEGMNATTSKDTVLEGPPSTVSSSNVTSSAKVIDADHHEVETNNLPDFVKEMTEEDRKRWKKKSRKKRSQLRKKLQREANKTSPDSESEPNPNEIEAELEGFTPKADSFLMEEAEEIQLGSNSSSLPVIEAQCETSSVAKPMEDWVRGGIAPRSIGPEFHFFSDTEMEIKSPDGSRPPSPVHSDTEYEVGSGRPKGSEMDDEVSESCPQQSWRWGELPSPPVPNRSSPPKTITGSTNREMSSSDQSDEAGAIALASESPTGLENKGRQPQTTAEEEAKRSKLSDMFSFMLRTKKMRSQANAVGGGIYLDDLDVDALDPDLAARYITQNSFRRGLHDSKISRLRDEDAESGKGVSLPQSPQGLAAAATIGDSNGPRSVDSDFEDSRQDYRSLPDVALSLCGQYVDHADPSEELFLKSQVSYEDFIEDPRLVENPNLIVRIGSKYYTWKAACPIVMSWAAYQQFLPQTSIDSLVHEYMPKRQEKKTETVPSTSGRWWWPRRAQPKKESNEQIASNVDSTVQTEASGSEPIINDANKQEIRNPPVLEPIRSSHGTSSDNESDGSNEASTGKKLPMEKRPYVENTDVYRKTLRLTTEQIRQLHLREGSNEAMFSVTTAYQGTTRCKCHIYLWRYDDKVVISDIDGTITKSDVLGHILPIIGQDWAQSGVAQLFTQIKNNGYRILYLSARAIGQAHVTREYLRSVRQGDLSLPDGPLLLNPTSLLRAFHREVIEKKPEEFKISCLRDIQMLFPSNPFYAGYGNRVNDVWAYRAVGIPTSRIFTINPRGELKLEVTQSFQSSYSKQSFIVDLVFPPFIPSVHEVVADSEYNDFSYWRTDLALPDEDEATKFITSYSNSKTSRKQHLSISDKK